MLVRATAVLALAAVETSLDDIERHGYHLTDAHVRITERDLA